MEEEKIKMFVNDVVMYRAVYDVILDSFLKERKNADVQTLAASRIAIDLLRDAWRELEKHQRSSNAEKKETGHNLGM